MLAQSNGNIVIQKPSLAAATKFLLICFVALTVTIFIIHHPPQDTHTASNVANDGSNTNSGHIIPATGALTPPPPPRRSPTDQKDDNATPAQEDELPLVTYHTSRHNKKLSLLKNESHVMRVINKWQNFVLNSDKYFQKLLKTDEATSYLNNRPFPHTFFDDVFPWEIVELIMQEIPDVVEFTPQGCPLHAQVCWVTKTEKKAAMHDQFSFFTNLMISFMKSIPFLHFLEKLTNITALTPDPYNTGSGVHQIVRDGFLKIHADFNRNWDDRLHRRVNVFLFLNPFWKDEFGGFLELWSRDLSTCRPLKPRIGRLVVFSTDDFSYHGHPDPLKCPIHRSRKSIAQYYYTTTRPDIECEDSNCTVRGETKWVYPPKPCAESIRIAS